MATIVKNVILLLAIAVCLALFVNRFSPVGIPLFGQWNANQGVVRANPVEGSALAAVEIDDIQTAKQLYDQGGAVFVDARPLDAYQDGHVSGAVSLPAWDADAKIEAFLHSFPPEQQIVVYCSGRTCEDSHRLAEQLVDVGYLNVSIMIDGFPRWKARGFPVVR